MEAILVNVALPLANVVILLGVGLVLDTGDFRRIRERPRPLVVGLFGHYLLLPALGFAMAWQFRHEPAIAVGFVLIAACPSASASNLLTHLARGNTALAVTLTVISAVATLVTLPLMLNAAGEWLYGASYRMRLPFWQTMGRLAVLVLLPVVAGIALRRFRPRLALRIEPWVSRVGLAALMLAISTYLATNFPAFARSFERVGPATVCMSTVAIVAGLLLGRVSALSRRDTITIGMEVGVQNCMLALLVAFTLLRSPEVAVPAITYGVMMFLPAFGLVALGRRWRGQATAASSPGAI